jgi:hypothetical protein
MMPTNELFSPQELRALSALAERVVPSDKSGIGHLLRELAPDGALSSYYDTCRLFLMRLNENAGGDFAGLSASVQDELLTRLEANPEVGRPFRQIVEWITEGFYASTAGWELVGFHPVQREMR